MGKKPTGNGLVELHDSKNKERGFNCMRLFAFLTAARVTDWDVWHRAHLQAATGNCPYSQECAIYQRTVKRIGSIQLYFNF